MKHEFVGIARQAILDSKGFEGLPIEASYTCIKAEPQMSVSILLNGYDIVTGQTVGCSEGDKALSVVARYPAVRSKS